MATLTASPNMGSPNMGGGLTGYSTTATVAVDASDPMHITSPQLDEVNEKLDDLKKAIVRESGEDDRIQDLVDLTRVLIDEVRGMREDMKGDVLRYSQPQPQYPHQLAGAQPVPQWTGSSTGTAF